MSSTLFSKMDSKPFVPDGTEPLHDSQEKLSSLPVPKATIDAIAYIDKIDEDEIDNVLFTDSLVTTSDTGKELGEFTVSIERARYNSKDCFLIHANSHGAIDNVPMGTSITAYVSKTLETLEQQHHEYVKLEEQHLDKKTFIVMNEDKYIVNRIITQGEQVFRHVETYSSETMHGFISEGSNLLVQRLMVKKGIPEHCKFISFDSEAKLCHASYRSLEDHSQMIGDTEVTVTGIERTIKSLSDLPTTWQTYFLRDGRMSSRVQIGSPVTMRLLRVPPPLEKEEVREKPAVAKKPLHWEDDMQLYSKFLDRKEELKGDHATYMRHHPELKALLADFLQFLLLRKPENIVAFASDYFSAFSPSTKEGNPYATSGEARYIPRPESPFKRTSSSGFPS
ncbi:ciliogenesis-associated TTC17-interacting protein-like [Anneissia japonica]|uniref:ciliogenesis-associated TTC17-interacting protein-like n=1 Tax=Anneissia japonica TaxID=1529436 RepID=UPI00142567CD|nr:ciliogenesis-associated TTC17-interacting protein-like [Anneissia japonica]